MGSDVYTVSPRETKDVENPRMLYAMASTLLAPLLFSVLE
jgi:hypothetical protein